MDNFDQRCYYLQQALISLKPGDVKNAIRDIVFGPVSGPVLPCGPSTNFLASIATTLEDNFPILIKASLDENRDRNVLLRLTEALVLMELKLNSIGTSLDSLVRNKVQLTNLTYVPQDQGYTNVWDTVNFPLELGTQAVTETIVHEWGHALDRDKNRDHSQFMDTPGSGVYLSTSTRPDDCPQAGNYTEGGKYILSGSPSVSPGIYQRCNAGYGWTAARYNFSDPIEDWPDMFMGWVFDQYPFTLLGAGYDKDNNKTASEARRMWMNAYVKGAFT